MKSTKIILLSSVFWITGCAKEDPSPRPMQQQVTGTSVIVKIDADDWEPSGTPGDEIYSYVASGNANNITADIVARGTVKVQKMRPNGGYTDLPTTMEQDGVMMDWNYGYSAGQVTIQIDRNGAKITPPEEVTVYKVTAVPQL